MSFYFVSEGSDYLTICLLHFHSFYNIFRIFPNSEEKLWWLWPFGKRPRLNYGWTAKTPNAHEGHKGFGQQFGSTLFTNQGTGNCFLSTWNSIIGGSWFDSEFWYVTDAFDGEWRAGREGVDRRNVWASHTRFVLK